MNIAKGLFRKLVNTEALVKSKGFDVSECAEECSGCPTKYPSSVKIEYDGALWDLTKPYGLHLVVTTGKTDWPHDACLTSHTVAHQVLKWADSAKLTGLGSESDPSNTIKVSTSSIFLLNHEKSSDYDTNKIADILILPLFVWIRDVHESNAKEVLSKVIPDLVEAHVSGSKDPFKKEYPEFPEIKVVPDPLKAHVFLCSHRTRDKRCGVTAPIMKKEMDIHLRDLGLLRDFGEERPGGVHVSFINHVGGHKYSANVIIYLKESGKNIWLARCTPPNAVPIIDECIVNDGKVWPDKVRILQKFKPVDW